MAPEEKWSPTGPQRAGRGPPGTPGKRGRGEGCGPQKGARRLTKTAQSLQPITQFASTFCTGLWTAILGVLRDRSRRDLFFRIGCPQGPPDPHPPLGGLWQRGRRCRCLLRNEAHAAAGLAEAFPVAVLAPGAHGSAAGAAASFADPRPAADATARPTHAPSFLMPLAMFATIWSFSWFWTFRT